MKVLFSLFAFLLVLDPLTESFANEEAKEISCNNGEEFYPEVENVSEGKIYIKPGVAYFAKNGIFINFQGHLVAVNNLSVDSKGVYIQEDEFSQILSQYPWVCSNCNRKNGSTRKNCYNCGKGRDS